MQKRHVPELAYSREARRASMTYERVASRLASGFGRGFQHHLCCCAGYCQIASRIGSEVGSGSKGSDVAVKVSDTSRLGMRPLVAGRLSRCSQCNVERFGRGSVQRDWSEHPLGQVHVCEYLPDTRRHHPRGDAVNSSAAYGVRSKRNLCQTLGGNCTDGRVQGRRMGSHPDKGVERLLPSV